MRSSKIPLNCEQYLTINGLHFPVMIFRSCRLFIKRFVLTIGYALLLAGPPQWTSESIAAPVGMGMGPVCPPACAPNPANCDANLVISAIQSLSFGTMAAPTAGTVTVDINSIRSATGGVVLIPGGTVSAATFSMTTTPYSCTGRALVVVTVASPATLSNGSGATMTINNFATSLIAGDAFDPAVPLLVGGTLNVGTLQTSGIYSGNILLTVTFQ
ncbi:DUF4402 domain-containing protein [Kaarinaea lacus]